MLNGINQMHKVKNVFITDGSCMAGCTNFCAYLPIASIWTITHQSSLTSYRVITDYQ
jgi:hypothetical protein